MRKYSQLVTAFATVASFAIVAPAQAQHDDRLIAHVPFAFTVGETNLPSGTYNLSRMDLHREMLLLRGDQTGAFVRTSEMRLPRTNAEPSLVFHRYGNQYFLRQIQWEDTARLDLAETKGERKVAEGRSNLAAAQMETVVVPAGEAKR
jgi:hypothetical protein